MTTLSLLADTFQGATFQQSASVSKCYFDHSFHSFHSFLSLFPLPLYVHEHLSRLTFRLFPLSVTLTDRTSYNGNGYTRYGEHSSSTLPFLFFSQLTHSSFALSQVSNMNLVRMVRLLGSSTRQRVGEFLLRQSDQTKKLRLVNA